MLVIWVRCSAYGLLATLAWTTNPAEGQNLISTSQTSFHKPAEASGLAFDQSVRAAPADSFIDSIGVNTHWAYPVYEQSSAVLKATLKRSGIRHYRDDVGNGIVAKELAASGIRLTMLLDPPSGNAPTAEYWTKTPHHTLSYVLKELVGGGNHAIDAIEMPNELDVFYRSYRWHRDDVATLSKDPNSTDSWAKYGIAITRDSWNIIKSDPALAEIKVIGPALGPTAKGYPAESLAEFVDWGNFHPYPYAGNSMSYPMPYAGVQKYFWQTNQPTVNIDEWPYAFDVFQGAFTDGRGAKPMAATETGYYTGTSKRSITESTEAKYIPRLFAEYFRHGVVRTFVYEFMDEGTNLVEKEQNFGLLHHDLSPKPAFVALSSLIDLLQDRAGSFTPTSLAYHISVQPSDGYTRTQYLHDLLLQKSDGDFYLLLWHEVASSSLADSDGKELAGTARDLVTPSLTVSVALPPAVESATQFSYDPSWRLQPESLAIEAGDVTLSIGDTITVLKLVTQMSPSRLAPRNRSHGKSRNREAEK